MRASVCLLLAFSVLGLCLAAKDLYSINKSDVVSLSKLNFHNMIKKNRDDYVSVVQFYVPEDEKSQKLKDDFNALATSLKGIVRVGVVNCNNNADLCKEYEIKEYPTIKLFPAGAFKIIKDYSGDYSLDNLKKFAVKTLPNLVKKVTAGDLNEFLDKEHVKPHALLFTDKPKTASLVKALSVDFKGRIPIGEIQSSEAALVKQYKVKKFPTLVLLIGTKEKLFYKGELVHHEMFKWLNSYAETNAMEKAHDPSTDDAPPRKAWLSDPVPQVTSESFGDICLDVKGLCLIAFVDAVHAEGKAPTCDAAALATLLPLK
jgi:protein disulfide-isomerase A6